MSKKFIYPVILLIIFLLSGLPATFALSTWTQVGTDVGDVGNNGIFASAIYDSKFVVAAGIKTWEYDGTSWTQITTDGGIDSGEDFEIYCMAAYDGNLYAGINDDGGFGRVWKYNGTSWTSANEDNFDEIATGTPSMIVYNSNLYAGTTSDEADRANIYRYDSGTSWTQVNTNGFGDNNSGIDAMAVCNGNLYAGTNNSTTGTEIWKYDGTSWTQVNTDGFGDADNNYTTRTMAAYNNNLYVGTRNYATGTEIWRCTTCDGTDWTQVNSDGFGDTTNDGTRAMAVYNDNLYAGTYQWAGVGTEIWKCTTCDGTDWTQVNTDGFGDTNNEAIYTLNTFERKLYAGTYNDVTGGEVWSVYDEVNLSLTMSVDISTPSTGNPINYTLTLINHGPESATNIQITNTLSSDTSYVHSSPSQGTYDVDTGVWTVGTLASGNQTSLIINATVTATVGGTTITNSAEVTASDQFDSDSTPNNDDSSEDDQASAQSQLADPAVAGSPTFISSGGGSSVETLSGELDEEIDEEEEEELEEEPPAEEEEISEEEPPAEEEEISEEEPPAEEEISEEDLEEEKNILEEATKTVTTTVTEIVYTEPTPPTPPAPPTTYQPPAPPAPQPTEPTIFDSEEITSAIEKYEKKISTTEEVVPTYKPIKEIIEENTGQESIDSDEDGISDLFQLSRGIPLGNNNPDNDDYSNSTEFYCDLDPLTPDLLENTPTIPTLKEGVTTGDNIAIRLCSGTAGDSVDLMLVKKEDPTNQIYIGQTEIDEGNKGIILLQEPLEDGEYYVLVQGEEGMGEMTSFTVDKALVSKAPDIELVNTQEKLGKTIHFLITFNGKMSELDAEKFIADNTTSKIEGSSEPGLIVYATWQSRILSSVVISDASQGKFELEIPTDLPEGEHEILVYSYDEENALISNITSLTFSN